MSWRRILIGCAVAVYAVSLMWLSVGTPGTFTSPDENAAFTFAQAWRSYGELRVFEPLNLALDGVVHPRSVVAVGPWLVPGSFLGLPLLTGTIGKLVGASAMLLVTPLLAILAVFAWRSIIARLSGHERLATVAAVLFAAHPGFWFYSARTMMHNVALVAFLVFAMWFVVAQPFMKRRLGVVLNMVFAGLCVGIAVTMRTSEVLWIGAAIVFLIAMYRPSPKRLLALAAGMVIPVVLMAAVQGHIYGSPFVNGYTVEDSGGAEVGDVQLALAETPTSSVFDELLAVLLPFGLHEKAIVKNVWHFALALFPWMTALAAAGLLSAVKGGLFRDKHWKVLLVTFIGLAVWLGVVYGSWSFNDNPDPRVVTLGDSHVRYWLPVFLLSTPFVAYGIEALARGKTKVIAVATGLVAVLSFALVFFGHDGLWGARQELFESAVKRDAILAATEEDAVIVVDRADKFLWPHRSVMVPLRSDVTYDAMPAVLNETTLYYFGIPFPEEDMTYLNEKKLGGMGLRIDLVAHIEDEALYRITRVE